MSKKVIIGDYFAIRPQGSYSKHQKVKVYCHEEIPTPDLATLAPVQEKHEEIRSEQYVDHEIKVSPRFNFKNKQEQAYFSNKNSQIYDENSPLIKSSHTDTPLHKGRPLKGILKRSLNSEQDFASLQKQGKKLLESVQQSEKTQEHSKRNSEIKFPRKYNEMIEGLKIVNSEISETENQKQRRNSELPLNRPMNRHRRNNSSEISGKECYLIGKKRNQIELSEEPMSPSEQRASIKNEREQNAYYENQSIIQFSPRQIEYSQNARTQQNFHPKNRKKNRNTRTTRRQLTQAQTLINLNKSKNRKQKKKNVSASAMLNCHLYTHSNYDQESYLEQEEQSYSNEGVLLILGQIENLTFRLGEIEEEVAKSEYRIIQYQLENEIKNKNKILDNLHQENQNLRRDHLRKKNLYEEPAQVQAKSKASFIQFLQDKSYFIMGFLTILLLCQLMLKNEGTCRAP